jgi:hypothetical protein
LHWIDSPGETPSSTKHRPDETNDKTISKNLKKIEEGFMLKSNSKAARQFPQVKKPASLPQALQRNLNAYAMSAAAAGVAILACATPAQGTPICKNPSAAIHSNNSFPLNPIGVGPAPFLVAQSTLQYFLSTTGVSSLRWWNRGFFTPNSGGAKVLLASNGLPANVASGAEIGPGGQFGEGGSYGMLFTYGKGNLSHVQGGGTKQKHRGNLSLTQDSYVGFQFSHSGSLHYGWARLAVSFQKNGDSKQTVLHVLSFGYESTPTLAITAGSCSESEPANSATPSATSAGTSLGALALGSAKARD